MHVVGDRVGAEAESGQSPGGERSSRTDRALERNQIEIAHPGMAGEEAAPGDVQGRAVLIFYVITVESAAACRPTLVGFMGELRRQGDGEAADLHIRSGRAK